MILMKRRIKMNIGFEQMVREQKEERRKRLNKAGGGKQMEELELLEGKISTCHKPSRRRT
jgi:hypothetical protein